MPDETETLGPVSYLIVEFPGNKMTGAGLSALVDLVDQGVIRILDLEFVTCRDDGSVEAIQLADIDGDGSLDLTVFEGVSSGMLDQSDLDEAGKALQRGSSAGVLLFDYPGYGRCEGRPTEAGCYASAEAAYRWLTDEAKIPADRIILFGESLGGGPAVELATRHDHRALVLVFTFTTLPAVEAIMHRTQGAIMVKAALQLQGVLAERTVRLPLIEASEDQIGRLRPDLVSAGLLEDATA